MFFNSWLPGGFRRRHVVLPAIPVVTRTGPAIFGCRTRIPYWDAQTDSGLIVEQAGGAGIFPGLTDRFGGVIVHAMNENEGQLLQISDQIDKFQSIMEELNKRCHERLRAQCDLFAVNEAELRCLRLFENQRYMTCKDMAAALGVVKSRVTKIVEGLERKGLVQRMPDPADSRVVLFNLTGLGREKWATAKAHVQAVNAAILVRLSEEQRAELLSALAMLKVSMEAVPPTGPEPAREGRDDSSGKSTSRLRRMES